MYKKFDSAVQALTQKAVDATGVNPGFAAELCVVIPIMMQAFRALSDPWYLVGVFAGLVWAYLFIKALMQKGVEKEIFGRVLSWVKPVAWAFTLTSATTLFLILVLDKPYDGIFKLLQTVLRNLIDLLSMYLFMCNDPPPPRRRERMVPQV